MNTTNHSINKSDTEYLVHLIRIALADNVISENEFEMLHRISKNLGYTEAETDHLIRTTRKSDYNPPSELVSRFGQIFEIVNMTLADGTIDKNEMRLASGFAAKCGFNEKEIPALLVMILAGIRQGKGESELFQEYQLKLKS